MLEVGDVDLVAQPADFGRALRVGLCQLGAAGPVLLPSAPSFFALAALPVSPDGAATCPRWLSFLAETFGDEPEAVQLQHNGFVELSWGLIRLRAPDDVALSSLYGDSKLAMDLVLKAYAQYRQVGPERIRVTSLGKAQKESTYFDAYGRVWQSRAWAIPYQDSMLGLISLPTPEGFVGVYFEVPTSAWPVMLERERLTRASPSNCREKGPMSMRPP